MHFSSPFKSAGNAIGGALKDVGKSVGDVYKTVYYDWYAKNVYDVFWRDAYNQATGHYARQQKRLAREQQRRQERLEAQQRQYAYNQRKAQIDELRERVGAGGTRYRTNMQDRKMTSSLFGGNGNVETLG